MNADHCMAQAGTLESGDIMILIDLGGASDRISIDLQSPSSTCYGPRIRSVIRNTLDQLGINRAYVKAEDKGALDCTISARVETAVKRASYGHLKEG